MEIYIVLAAKYVRHKIKREFIGSFQEATFRTTKYWHHSAMSVIHEFWSSLKTDS